MQQSDSAGAGPVPGSLITIGDEILIGDIPNGNARHIALELRAHGFRLARILTVGDQEAAIVEAMRQCLKGSRFLVVTGGLGPTEDDRTPDAVAKALDRPLEVDETYMAWLRKRLADAGRAWNDAVGKMAFLPRGAVKLGIGMAGFALEHEGIPCYFLPGVPREMRALMAELVMPDLDRRFPLRFRCVKDFLRIQGLFESEIAERLKGFDANEFGVEIGYLPQGPEVWLTLLASAPSEDESKRRVSLAEESVRLRFDPHHISGRGEESLERVAGRLLRASGWRLAVAESCTGGAVSTRITSVPGASDYFEGGCIAYSNAVKQDLLGVPESILRVHGAVSEPVAAAMAEGMRRLARVDFALAVTGIAGPQGGTADKPVGTVCIACASRDGTVVHKHLFRGDRESIQASAAHAALVLLWRILTE